MIERDIVIDLQSQGTNNTSIIFTQGVSNAVLFRFIVMDGVNKLSTDLFSRATVTLSHERYAFYHDNLNNDLSIVLQDPAFFRVGLIIGTLDMEFTNGNITTSYFSFRVRESLNRINCGDRNLFVNEIQELIDELNYMILGIEEWIIDGGPFIRGRNPIALHNIDRNAHPNLVVDGAGIEIYDDSMTLEEHKINNLSHSNIIVNGGVI